MNYIVVCITNSLAIGARFWKKSMNSMAGEGHLPSNSSDSINYLFRNQITATTTTTPAMDTPPRMRRGSIGPPAGPGVVGVVAPVAMKIYCT